MDPEEETLQMQLLDGHDETSSRIQIFYKLLLENLLSKDLGAFKNLIEQNLKKHPSSIDINHAYSSRSDETCLDIACKNDLPEFVSFLLFKGAKVNRINLMHNRGPIHFATENSHVDVLRVLLDEPTINPNLEAGQQTALHMAVKKNDLTCAKLLLEKGASPNIPNSKGVTAVHMAAMKKHEEMVKIILQTSSHSLDLDNYKDYNDETTREVLQKKLPDVALPPVHKREVNVHDLKYYLNANDQANFLKSLRIVKEEIVNNVADDLLEMAVQRNFREAVEALLGRNRGSGCNLEKAAYKAVQQGLPEILRKILHVDPKIGNHLVINACLELGVPGGGGSGKTSDRLECLKMILEREDVDVHCTDSKGNTPLHYAARAGCREAIALLLEKGSYIGQLNNFGVPPVADVPAPTLSQYFDDCLQMRRERVNEYTIEFNYSCLIPRENMNQPDNQERDAETDLGRKREMDVFRYIASNSALKPLLKHPLLSSFLYLKWHRIRHLLYINFALYVLFYLLINTYILYITYEKSVETLPLNGTALNVFARIAWALLVIREILQFISSPCHYVSSFENWLEVTLIILGGILFDAGGNKVSAIVILLSAWELVILIGQHPRMSTGIQMFKTISLNFLRFLFLYAFLILAFALAFFTLLNEDAESFPNPGQSLFKTVIMLTGEFDAKDISFGPHPILSRFIFVLFVFLIAIVLFNLLNGLAVSDTADILGKAELVALISRINLVAYMENLAVDAPFFRRPRCCVCHGFAHPWKHNPLRFLASRVLLFPNYLKGGKLCVKPYDGLETRNRFSGRVYYEKGSIESGKHKVFQTFNMDKCIIRRAKEILSKRAKESDDESEIVRELKGLKARLKKIEISLDVVKQGVTDSVNKVDLENK